MRRAGSKTYRAFAAFLVFATLLTGMGTMSAAADSSSIYGKSMVRTSLDDIKSLITSDAYTNYLSVYESVKDAETPVNVGFDSIVTEGENKSTATYARASGVFTDNDGNVLNDVLVMADDGNVTFKIDNIPEDAMYSIEVEYYTGNVYIYTCAGCGKSEVTLTRRVLSADSKCSSCGAVNGEDGKISESYSKSADVERSILLDGKVPFKESRSIELTKIWVDEYYVKDSDNLLSDSAEFKTLRDGEKRLFRTDNNSNESRPEKSLVSKWITDYLYDSTGYNSTPLKYYFSAGTHEITFSAIREPLVVKSITLKKENTVPTYDEYLAKYPDVANIEGASVKVQAEYSKYTSNKTIYQVNDRTSVASEPQDASQVRYNEIGGDKWQYVGQWVEWDITVPETGFYSIILRSKQDIYSGVFVSRKIEIDGEIPFKEANNLRFNYSDTWLTNPLNDGTTEFKFYLEAGDHVIRMEAVLGNMAKNLSLIENSLQKINGYYRKILMVTGPEPDTYRDYGFEGSMPDVIRGLMEQAALLYRISDELEEIIGYTGDHSVILDKAAYTLETMGKKPTKIASNMSTLKTQIGSIGTWLTQTQNQPLDVDYILIQSPDAEIPEAEASFWDVLWGEIVKFFMSFFADYTSIGSFAEEKIEYDKDLGVDVWTFTSRDQSQIIRNLVDNDFTTKYPGVSVNIKLVVADTLLPATLAGTGPDVALGLAQSSPINYAIRSAVMSLNSSNNGYDFRKDENGKFSYLKQNPHENPVYSVFADSVAGFDDVTSRFSDAAMVPFTLYGETFAIPETMSFSMLFYRKDIFAELDMTVPSTWDEFYDTIYNLYSNNLEIGFPTGVTGSTILMYQQDETMYDEGNYDDYMKYFGEQLAASGNTFTDGEGNVRPKTDGMTINLDSDISLANFKQVCQLFTMYSFPVSYEFSNRFRSGEMPMAIADYTAYNQLIVFAPEINGLWEFTTLPGTLSEDGTTINNKTVATVSGMVVMRGINDKNAFSAWTFMQWWSSKDMQSAYGNEIESLLGPSAKYSTANLEALYDMSWSKSEYDNLYAQFQAITCTPEYPGGYIIARYTNFAFLDVYNNGDEPVEKLLSYMNQINSELSRKRAEFGLPIAEDYNLANAKAADTSNTEQ